MRISDWSSDVCSSDLTQFRYQFAQAQHVLVNGLGDLPFSEFPAIGDFKGANGCIPNGLGTPSRKFIVAQAVPGVFGGRLIQQVVAVRVVPVIGANGDLYAQLNANQKMLFMSGKLLPPIQNNWNQVVQFGEIGRATCRER